MNHQTVEKIKNYIAERWEQTCPADGDPGYLPVPHRYVTSATEGHLKHLFYWDAYFSGVGLLRQGRTDLATSTLEALIHLFCERGLVPNLDMEEGTNRSQLPFLSHYVRMLYEHSGDKAFLESRVSILKNEYIFWMTDRAAPIAGLNRFFHSATEQYLIDFYVGCICDRVGLDPNVSREEQLKRGIHYLTEAESTCDFTSRFLGRAADFIALDLNANLYGYETNFAWFAEQLGRDEEVKFWQQRAAERQKRFSETFWNEEQGFFFDYDFVNQCHTPVWTPMGYTAMWNGLATAEQAKRMVANLPKLEAAFGLTATDKVVLDASLQWDWPFGWPPHQYLTVHGLLRYGYVDDAKRIATHFLGSMVRVFEETGHLWEKYDAVEGGLKSSEYPVQTQMGWSAAVFLDFYALLHE